jgi:excinuclease ABC subunit C
MGYDVPVFGMVKDDHHRTRAIAQDGGEIAIRSNRSAFTLVSAIQEEVHRFAIGYHRQKRSAAALSSKLTDIPTVGEKRAAALMKHFKTLRALSEATEEELLLVPGINRPSAEAICQYFRETKENRKNS